MEKVNYLKTSTNINPLQSRHPLFGVDAVLNPYAGCLYNCLYCPFISGGKKVGVKTDFLHGLDKKLSQQKEKICIGLGSNIEPYSSVEKEFGLSRNTIELIMKYEFPLHIFTKSELILRDIGLLKEYSEKGLLAVSVSVPASSNKLLQILEPEIASIEDRFEVLHELKRHKIFAGLVLAPIIPYIGDSKKHIEEVFKNAKKVKAEYILPSVLVMSTPEQRKRVVGLMLKEYPKIRERFETLYGDKIMPAATYTEEINSLLVEFGKKYKTPLYLPTEESKPSDVDICQELLK